MTFTDGYSLRSSSSANFNAVANAVDGAVSVHWGGTTGGTSTAYTATPSPAWTTTTRTEIRFIILLMHATNTGASTLNISSIGTGEIRQFNAALVGGEMLINSLVMLAWDGTHYEIVGPSGLPPLYSTGSAIGVGTSSPAANYLLDVRGRLALGSGASSNAEVGWRHTGNANFAWLWSTRTDVGGSNDDFKLVRNNSSGVFQEVSAQVTTANGYFMLGYSTSNGAYRLQVNSQIFATNATVATSDGRYKENLLPVWNGRQLVEKLSPVSFDWKKHPVHNLPEGRDVGFIAQEVYEALKGTGYEDAVIKKNHTVLPDGTEEEFLGLKDAGIIPVLTAALKEVIAEQRELKQELAELRAKVG